MSDPHPSIYGHSWKYLPSGHVVHLVSDHNPLSGQMSFSAICGTSPPWYVGSWYWRGTGSQAEYDQVDALPACRRCTGTYLNDADLRVTI